LYDKPQTLFVAGFIGSPAMNILDAVCGGDGKSMTLFNGDVITAASGAENLAGKSLKAGMRPEHLHLAGSHDAQFSAHVDVVEQLGADTIVHGTLLNTEEQLSVRLDGIQRLERGSTIGLSVDPANVHLFDPQTTQRVN
ncbi:MAG: TOBE domain-containing protein, partial [Cohaesibacter sp.]|nr:TOBE domain-containing protein [Cohaesibacter sp.]